MRSFIRRNRVAARDDEGSGLILVFLVMLVSSGLSLVLLEGAVSQANQTQANNKRVTSLSAAQAGLDATLGQLRDATAVGNPTGGELSAIPCTVAGGQVGGTVLPTQGTSTGSYTVKVAYYSVDPTAQSDAWRQDSSNQINCPSGGHPDRVPTYALMISTGYSKNDGKPRSVQSTYTFTTSNKNLSGGLIHTTGGGDNGVPDLCPDAGSAHPSTGDAVTMQPCDKNNQGQVWAYQTDLSMLLVSTTNDQAPKSPMCITVAGNPAPKGTPLLMGPCSGLPGTTAVSYTQQFSYDDNGQFENTKQVNGQPTGTLSGNCWVETNSNTAGSALTINTCGQQWRPEASVGAGMSGDGVNVGLNTQQLVNFSEFGRCLDATGQNPNAAYMIAYPCKQSPTASEITWNQKYSYSGTTTTYGTYSTYDTANSTTYCLTSPMSAESDPTVVGPFVTLTACPTVIPNSMKWKAVGASTGDYNTEYTIQDDSVPPLCLGVGEPGAGSRTATGLNEWSTPYVQVCNGSTIQKWNAPPNAPPGSVNGTNETGTGSTPPTP